MFRTLFVPALRDPGFRSSLRAALPIARTFHAHIMALHVIEPLTPSPPSELAVTAELIAEQEERREAQGAALEQTFLEFCADEDLDILEPHEVPLQPQAAASWIQARGMTEEKAAAFALQADLIVLTRGTDSSASFNAEFEDAMVTKSGPPILISPEVPPLALPGHLVVAWNGSPEAARTITLAEPFLTHAGEVTVLTIGKLPSSAPSAEDMATTLRRKGIKARAEKHAKPHKGSVREAIDEAVDECGGDLLIMGAYSHAKWRENIFGGVTRDVLRAGELPILLAH